LSGQGIWNSVLVEPSSKDRASRNSFWHD